MTTQIPTTKCLPGHTSHSWPMPDLHPNVEISMTTNTGTINRSIWGQLWSLGIFDGLVYNVTNYVQLWPCCSGTKQWSGFQHRCVVHGQHPRQSVQVQLRSGPHEGDWVFDLTQVSAMYTRVVNVIPSKTILRYGVDTSNLFPVQVHCLLHLHALFSQSHQVSTVCNGIFHHRQRPMRITTTTRGGQGWWGQKWRRQWGWRWPLGKDRAINEWI